MPTTVGTVLGPSQGFRMLATSPMWVTGTHIFQPFLLYFRACIIKKLESETYMGLKLGTPIQNSGSLTDLLTTS